MIEDREGFEGKRWEGKGKGMRGKGNVRYVMKGRERRKELMGIGNRDNVGHIVGFNY